ncbi:hypothetical protein GCM10009787_48330 [Streptomyces bangladeshensis]|uniref:Uncharacterized protein n=1 Tax=Streptomyces bangladeshensis TaxID=295352 RepID=A0ABN3BSU4_9ACTN
MACDHWIGAEQRYCRSTNQVRHFLPGMRCPAHTPNALKGVPEVPPGPGRPRDWATPLPPRTPTARDKRPLAAVKPTEESR